MKFRFCGDLDAPDWILAEVSVLSKMSSVRMTLICRQVIAQLLGEGINYEKIDKLTKSDRLLFGPSEVKAMIAALHFVLFSSAKYDVDDSVLLGELMQLGLPKDISTSISKCYVANKDGLRKRLTDTSFQLSRMKSVEWRVDYVLSSSAIQTFPIQEVQAPTVRLQLTTTKNGPVSFEVPSSKFRVLHNELKAARLLMDSVT